MKTEFKEPAFKVIIRNGKSYIFDIIRKKYVILTPEEKVRQFYIHYLIANKGFPKSLLAVEKAIVYNKMEKRCDVVAFNSDGKAVLIVECKNKNVKITQKTFDQIGIYNANLKVPYLVVTNGLTQYACKIDHANQSYKYLDEIPFYKDL